MTTLPALQATRPKFREQLDVCVHCGFCLPTCPTYALWGEEMDSPRGRIYLMRMASEGAMVTDETLVTHLDRCLGCMACVPACPSGVRYDQLVFAARAEIEARRARPPLSRLQRAVIFRLFPYAGRLRAALLPARIAERLGVMRFLARDSVRERLPVFVRTLLELMPPAAPNVPTLAEVIPAVGPRRLRVGLLTGCVQDALFAHVNAATARVLAAEGCEVIVPRSQGCCGALGLHAGKDDDARRHARRVMRAFARTDVDAIVVNAAGCGSAMKDYGALFEGEPDEAEALRIAGLVRDVAELLGGLAPRAPRNPLPMTVAYHDPCHLQHAQGIRTAPRALLASIPGLTVREVPEAALCCGSAGIYNLTEPRAARDLGDRKAANLLTTGADLVVASNPGCALQIGASLRRAGHEIPVAHLVEILDASIRGVPLDTTAGRVAGASTVSGSPVLPGR